MRLVCEVSFEVAISCPDAHVHASSREANLPSKTLIACSNASMWYCLKNKFALNVICVLLWCLLLESGCQELNLQTVSENICATIERDCKETFVQMHEIADIVSAVACNEPMTA